MDRAPGGQTCRAVQRRTPVGDERAREEDAACGPARARGRTSAANRGATKKMRSKIKKIYSLDYLINTCLCET